MLYWCINKLQNIVLRLGQLLLDSGALKIGSEPHCGVQLTPADVSAFDFFGPSVRCLNGNLIHRLNTLQVERHAIIVWVVDTEEILQRLLRMRVRSMVSNDPYRLLRNLSSERGCSVRGKLAGKWG